ncbi:Phosphate transport system permease protein PstA [Thermogutta terrifontis]|uniref:Phosphate transport system permease protein PstA n=1 Tax=Thermogutta terrifontis TaxID=1331910 RepID=A0A286REV6_9BACT|nr:Phosphate transport system permease protein PstA [Thermogutta terrifontis]
MLSAYAEPSLWLTGGALVIALTMMFGLLALILVEGTRTFWPLRVVRWELPDRVVMGEITRSEWFRPDPQSIQNMSPELQKSFQEYTDKHKGWVLRYLVRTGNYELTNEHFQWVSAPEILLGKTTWPDWVIVLERMAWGRFYGIPVAFVIDGQPQVTTPSEAWENFLHWHPEVRRRFRVIRRLETRVLGDINHDLESARLRLRSVELEEGKQSPRYRRLEAEVAQAEKKLNERYESVRQEIERLRAENARYAIRLKTADGQEKDIALADIVRAYPANQLDLIARCQVYLSRVWEFLTDEPREANTEGGIFPAIFGTAFLTLLMTIAVVPMGVLAALYLREYAKGGVIVSGLRIAINNLAGVPSIVFGVFGLGFFCYLVGGSIDSIFFQARLPNPTFGTGGILWASLTLALLTLPVVIVATEEALAAVPRSVREGSYACGATRWQTLRRVVIPQAFPGILTGTILAMARGAGEVAPLMLTGAVKLAPELPIDHRFPYIHLQRSFMHLGFHIYDLGFQSPNSEAAKPMVFSTTLVLILLILALNLWAFALRARLRRASRVLHL